MSAPSQATKPLPTKKSFDDVFGKGTQALTEKLLSRMPEDLRKLVEGYGNLYDVGNGDPDCREVGLVNIRLTSIIAAWQSRLSLDDLSTLQDNFSFSYRIPTGTGTMVYLLESALVFDQLPLNERRSLADWGNRYHYIRYYFGRDGPEVSTNHRLVESAVYESNGDLNLFRTRLRDSIKDLKPAPSPRKAQYTQEQEKVLEILTIAQRRRLDEFIADIYKQKFLKPYEPYALSQSAERGWDLVVGNSWNEALKAANLKPRVKNSDTVFVVDNNGLTEASRQLSEYTARHGFASIVSDVAGQAGRAAAIEMIRAAAAPESGGWVETTATMVGEVAACYAKAIAINAHPPTAFDHRYEYNIWDEIGRCWSVFKLGYIYLGKGADGKLIVCARKQA